MQLVVDWDRIHYGLMYALTHGGNMPPGFFPEEDHSSEE